MRTLGLFQPQCPRDTLSTAGKARGDGPWGKVLAAFVVPADLEQAPLEAWTQTMMGPAG